MFPPRSARPSQQPTRSFLPWPAEAAAGLCLVSRQKRGVEGARAERISGLPRRGPSLYLQSGLCKVALSASRSKYGQGLVNLRGALNAQLQRGPFFTLTLSPPSLLLCELVLAVTASAFQTRDHRLQWKVSPSGLLYLLPLTQVKSLPLALPHQKDARVVLPHHN